MANQLTPASGPSKAVAGTTGNALATTTAAEPLTYASAVERWEQGTDLTAYDLYDLEGNKILRYFKQKAQPPDEAVYEATYAELQAVADYITRDCRALRGDECREKAARQFDDHACARLAQLVASDIDSTLVRVEMTRRIAYGAQCPAFLRNATAALVEEKMQSHVSGKDPGAPILRYFRGDDFPGMAAWFTVMIKSLRVAAVGTGHVWQDHHGAPVEQASLTSFIRRCLEERARLSDPRTGVWGAPVNSWVVSEVLRSLAALLMTRQTRGTAWDDDGDGGEPQPVVTAAAFAVAALPGNDFGSFAAQHLALVAGEWVTSDSVSSAYSAWCAGRGVAGDETRVMFKKLQAWAGDGVKPAKRGPKGGQVHGYVGLRLK